MSDDFTGTGWAFPLAAGDNRAIRMVTGNALLEQSMRLILTTYPGERPMRPKFGSRLRDYVFAGTDPATLNEVNREVTYSLGACEPRVDIKAVRVEPDPDDSALVRIQISYAEKGTNDFRNMVFPFYTLPDDDVTPDDQNAGA
ncbi:baseplate protein [Streptomyces sp. SID685]|uniref:GPW/gp25 family protein n=1 Tax=Streptomyces TaxID=1883 RepID=UPI001371011A|nr:baseplate protein [Streptomyces sp. SID685]